MSAPQELLAFSKDRPLWQQDVIRRLFTKTDFTEGDMADARSMLEKDFRLSDVAPTPVPLTEADVPRRMETGDPVTLNSIGNLVNANRLATGQTLSFAIKGLTIIYGDNGSGKSGYCRILKKLCRVREGGDEEIRGNLFKAASAALPAQATVRFSVGAGEPAEARWKVGDAPPTDLSRISVFDAKSAALYADTENKIEFLPQSLDVLSRLSDTCDRIATHLDGDIAQLRTRIAVELPDCEGAPAEALLARLSSWTLPQDLASEADLEAACTWTSGHAEELERAETQLRTDASSVAATCDTLVSTLRVIEDELSAARKILDGAALAECRKLISAAKTAREAATLAATAATPEGVLPGFGGEAWRRLFQYAREYSAVAYLGETFPVTRDGARCLLCQQELGAEAAERLALFDRHVKGAAEAEAQRCEQAVAQARQRLSQVDVRSEESLRAMLVSLNQLAPNNADTITAQVVAYSKSLSQRKLTTVEALQSGQWADPEPLSARPDLEKMIAAFEAHAQAQRDSANPDARQKLLERAAELRGGRTLHQSRATLLARRRDLDRLSRLMACKKACDTTAISRKNTELRRKYLTKDFEARVLAEIGAVALHDLPFKVQDRTKDKKNYVGVGLDTPVKVHNRDVLSDGEFRALAIACFLADIGSIAGHDGIIIDDPVSSLDSPRTRLVARRLVREARSRQVVVFTHDLVFFNELHDAAAQEDVPVVEHWIRRTEDYGYGTVFEGEAPWQAKKVKERLGELDHRIPQLRKAPDKTGDAYREQVKAFYTDLRETWERLVEELLLGNVVWRFRSGVETRSLGQVEVTDDDYRRVYFGMKRASEYSGHDSAVAKQAILPSVDDMTADVQELRTYADELRKRNEKTQKDRRKLEQPTPGQTA